MYTYVNTLVARRALFRVVSITHQYICIKLLIILPLACIKEITNSNF